MNISTPPKDRVMTTKEVSQYLRIPISSLWRLTKLGRIRGVKVGKHWRYVESDVRTFLNGAENGTGRHRPVTDRRKSPRLNCKIQAQIRNLLSSMPSLPLPGVINNLSVEGARVLLEKQGGFKAGDPVEIIFEILEIWSPRMEVKGRVVYASSNSKLKVGIKFRLMNPETQGAIQNYVG